MSLGARQKSVSSKIYVLPGAAYFYDNKLSFFPESCANFTTYNVIKGGGI